MKKVLKFFGKFFAVIYSYVFFLVMGLLLSITIINTLISGNVFEKLIQNVNVDEIDLSVIGFGEEGEKPSDMIKKQALEMGFDEETANKIVENEDVKMLLGNFMDDALKYYLQGGEAPNINKDEIKSLIEKNDLEEYIELDNLDELTNTLNQTITISLPDKDKLINDSDIAVLKYVNTYLNIMDKIYEISPYMIYIIVIGYVVISYLLLALLNWNFITPFKEIGLSLLFNGIIELVIRFILLPLIPFNKVFSNPDVVINIIAKPLLIIGIVCIVLGIILIVINAINKKKKEDKMFELDVEEKHEDKKETNSETSQEEKSEQK